MRKLTQRLPHEAIVAAFSPIPRSTPVAIAVSGGSDSMALLHMAVEAFADHDVKILATTVDHGLRAESRAEAEQVAAWCAALGVEHRLLVWDHGGDIPGNLSNAAREARYGLMQAECVRSRIPFLLTGHTLDDQAETVLMHLARGSGVDGLSAIGASVSLEDRACLRRPLLGFTREQLRGHLRAIGQTWVDDPTNENDAYDRVKARKMFKTLEPLGLTKERLATTARLMGMAREALEEQAGRPQDVWEWTKMGFARVDQTEYWRLPREIALRRLAGAMSRLSGATYRPRLRALEATFDQVRNWPGARSLHGSLVRQGRGHLVVMREPNACQGRPQPAVSMENWDNRFKIEIDSTRNAGLTIAMLGEEGLRQIPKDYKGMPREWRDSYKTAKLTTPALWDGDRLLSAPLASWHVGEAPAFAASTIWPASCEDGNRG